MAGGKSTTAKKQDIDVIVNKLHKITDLLTDIKSQKPKLELESSSADMIRRLFNYELPVPEALKVDALDSVIKSLKAIKPERCKFDPNTIPDIDSVVSVLNEVREAQSKHEMLLSRALERLHDVIKRVETKGETMRGTDGAVTSLEPVLEMINNEIKFLDGKFANVNDSLKYAIASITGDIKSDIKDAIKRVETMRGTDGAITSLDPVLERINNVDDSLKYAIASITGAVKSDVKDLLKGVEVKDFNYNMLEEMLRNFHDDQVKTSNEYACNILSALENYNSHLKKMLDTLLSVVKTKPEPIVKVIDPNTELADEIEKINSKVDMFIGEISKDLAAVRNEVKIAVNMIDQFEPTVVEKADDSQFKAITDHISSSTNYVVSQLPDFNYVVDKISKNVISLVERTRGSEKKEEEPEEEPIKITDGIIRNFTQGEEIVIRTGANLNDDSYIQVIDIESNSTLTSIPYIDGRFTIDSQFSKALPAKQLIYRMWNDNVIVSSGKFNVLAGSAE